ncbi:MAG: hypothetical protein K2M31_10175 [Muribaculaceae bacterium]|nr:hypothetical protein [Muribaculaceae bacterium]
MSDNGRIAKNTIFLYFRMILLTIINIYTVRVVLNALGVEDYGIFSVIGSAVYMLGFLQATLSSATQRYFSYQLADKNTVGYRRLFSQVMIVFLIMAAVILIIGGILGPFVVDDFLNLPADRLTAAMWVYYSSLGSFILLIMTIPFTASMISHEKMNGFAYLSIFDGLFKLGVAYAIMLTSYDRLIFYAILSFIQSLVTFGFYVIYCRRNFEGVRFEWCWEKNLVKELLGYTGWNLFGSVSAVLATSGQGLLLNLFFGPLINAAKGIADRIYSVIQSFSSNFYLAVSPQIIKSYANKDINRMNDLVISSSKFSFYLLLVLSFPLIVCMDGLLDVWLGSKNVGYEMIVFSQLALVYALVNCLEQPITQMIRATGKIRNYQIVIGCFTLLFLPIAALALWLGAAPQTTMVILIILTAVVQIIRVIMGNRQLGFPIGRYFKEAISPILQVSLILAAGWVMLSMWHTTDIGYHIVKGLAALAAAMIIILILGMNRGERSKAINVIRSKLKI